MSGKSLSLWNRFFFLTRGLDVNEPRKVTALNLSVVLLIELLLHVNSCLFTEKPFLDKKQKPNKANILSFHTAKSHSAPQRLHGGLKPEDSRPISSDHLEGKRCLYRWPNIPKVLHCG